ncbi:Rrf2 family transcriptional regulator [Aestuariibius sp. 2305UL40-4]|uniref:Rrf2 family transcriptional regulator n=1 Tax=Aestuariibius violaceus TaxID=3234132 RepID=UPI00345EF6FA
MKRNSRLSLALHTLGHMAADPGRPLTSAEIAGHSDTHPAFVRRVLGPLKDGGILRSEKGHAGGWSLARPAEEITLADVYVALGERFLRPEPEGEDNPVTCAIEKALRGGVEIALDRAEATLIAELAHMTIASLAIGRAAPQDAS